jgi:hypothetical protein
MRIHLTAKVVRNANLEEFFREYEVPTGSYDTDEDDEGRSGRYEIVLTFECNAVLEDGVWVCNIEGGYHSDYDFDHIVEETKQRFVQDLMTEYPDAVVSWV